MEAVTSNRMKRIQLLVLALALTPLLAACGWTAEKNGRATASVGSSPAQSPEPSSTTSETVPAPAPAPVRCAPAKGGEQGIYTNLVDVRVGSHAGFDRIVFEFAAPEPNPGGKAGIPAYEIRTAKPPLRQDASGQRMSVNGNAFVGLVFHGAAGYDFEGNPTYDGPNRLRPKFDVLAEVAKAGDFEATLSWYLGLNRRTCWAVRELSNPDRVVIDFPHS